MAFNGHVLYYKTIWTTWQSWFIHSVPNPWTADFFVLKCHKTTFFRHTCIRSVKTKGNRYLRKGIFPAKTNPAMTTLHTQLTVTLTAPGYRTRCQWQISSCDACHVLLYGVFRPFKRLRDQSNTTRQVFWSKSISFLHPFNSRLQWNLEPDRWKLQTWDIFSPLTVHYSYCNECTPTPFGFPSQLLLSGHPVLYFCKIIR